MPVYLTKLEQKTIEIAKSFLTEGKIVIFPTETVYALAVRADSPAALEKLFIAKARPANKALTLLIGSSQVAKKLLVPHSKVAELIDKYMPGPLTVVAEKSEYQPYAKEVNDGSNFIGIRIPRHDFALKLLNSLDFLVVATSCNLSGGSPATSIEQIPSHLREQIDLIINGGESEQKLASTIVKYDGDTEGKLEIIRQGSLKLDKIIQQGESS